MFHMIESISLESHTRSCLKTYSRWIKFPKNMKKYLKLFKKIVFKTFLLKKCSIYRFML